MSSSESGVWGIGVKQQWNAVPLPEMRVVGWAVAAACLWAALHVAAPAVVRSVAPNFHKQLTPQKQRSVATLVVGGTHAIVAVVGAAVVLPQSAALQSDVYGGDVDRAPAIFVVLAVSAGYFLWDLAVTLYEGWGGGFLIHAVCCNFVYLNALHPFFAYFAVSFLLYEASTPLLHLRQCFIYAKATSTLAFKIINVAFILTFFAVRIVFGFKLSFTMWLPTAWRLVTEQQHLVHSFPIVAVFVSICVVLNALNIYWLTSLVMGQLKRRGSKPSKADAKGGAAGDDARSNDRNKQD